MRDALESYLALASGVTDITRQRAVAVAKALVAQGEATAEQVTGLAEDLVAQTRQNRAAVVALVGFEVDRALGRVGLASADEVTQLTERVRALEAQLRDSARSSSGSAPTARSSSGPVTTRAAGAPAVAVAEAPAKKAPAREAPAREAPARKAPARKAAARESAPTAADGRGGR